MPASERQVSKTPTGVYTGCIRWSKTLNKRKIKEKRKHYLSMVKSGAKVDWLDSLLKNEVVVSVSCRGYSGAALINVCITYTVVLHLIAQ